MIKKHRIFGVILATVMGLSCLALASGCSDPDSEGDDGTLDETTKKIEISNLQVNNSVEPLGLDDAQPVFSWALSSSARCASQTAYRVILKDGSSTVWDSGRVKSKNNYGVVYNGPDDLKSKTRYEWTVTVWDAEGEKYVSEPSNFETGIMNGEWNSEWIGDGENYATASRAATLLRTTFNSDAGKEIDFARVYISGLGYYELKINGKSPDDSVLNSVNTDYNYTVLYDVYDVTDIIKAGTNAVCVELGNGFYNESFSGWNWSNASWRATPRLRFELDITYKDKTTKRILSDENWKISKNGPVTANSIYHGETIDARNNAEFSSVDYDDALWQNAKTVQGPRGELVWHDSEKMRKTASFGNVGGAEAGIEIIRSGAKQTVTVPRMITGWAQITFKGTTAGQQIVIDYGEKLNVDGSLVLKDEQGIFQRDIYICRGGTETYEPKFNYKGYQYVQITGYDGTLTEDDVVCYMINSDVATTAKFDSSSDMLNELHSLMTNTLLNNFQGKPTDTPFLEKNGWLGDINVAIETMCFDFDISRFMQRFLRDVKDTQKSSGTIAALAPIYQWGAYDSPVWNSMYIFTVKELSEKYGLGNLVEENYDSLKKLAESYINTLKTRQWIWADNQLDDWVSPVGVANAQYDEHSVEGSALVATAYVYKALGVMEQFALSLDNSADADEFSNARHSILEKFNAKFLSDGVYDTGKWNAGLAYNRTRYRQTSNIIPLAFGMVPEGYETEVVENLVNDIIEKDYHLDTGILGTKYILPVLCDYGYTDIAYEILTQNTYPSWGYWLELGATSLWEMWESTARSHDHYFLGTYDEWFFSYLGGIKDVADGYRTFTLEPTIAGDLKDVDISLETVRGTLGVKWKIVGGKAQYDIVIPFGSTAKLYLPTGNKNSVTLGGETLTKDIDGVSLISTDPASGKVVVTLGGGTYKFTSPVER